MDQLKTVQVEAEALKKESIEAKFESLRSQVSPHFLFNSLNVLSNLVHKDADTASRFIDQLSLVYRYLLFNQENKTVPLIDEINFIQSYVYLLKIRFQNSLHIDIKVPENKNNYHIAPSTLQLLIENAIKHNIVSARQPLSIIVSQQIDKIVVENNIQLKKVKEPSSEVGLQNIRNRYKFLSDNVISVEETDNIFRVKIPLIPLQK